jgi:hypothetical protein
MSPSRSKAGSASLTNSSSAALRPGQRQVDRVRTAHAAADQVRARHVELVEHGTGGGEPVIVSYELRIRVRDRAAAGSLR